jgi:putative Mn2+ efflux pump MntP
MNSSRFISVLLIVFGAIVAVYAKAGAEQNVYILIAGIVLLMLGVYRISKNIPSKNDQETNEKNSQES